MNLSRIQAPVGFNLDTLPDPQPIFGLIQSLGRVSDSEMYRVFNMGIGFCTIVPDDTDVVRGVADAFAIDGLTTSVIGRVVADDRRRVFLPKQRLSGEGNEFTSV